MKTMTTRKTGWKYWVFPGFIFVATCFGIFVLPFFFPPPYVAGISVANVAGFNNKVASITAALLSVSVFLAALKGWWTRPKAPGGDYGRLSRPMVLSTTVICGGLLTLASFLIVRSHMQYLRDSGYFIEQISMHTEYGRKLYEQIEFPYGPLLFYAPIAVRDILSPWHVSLTAAYYTTYIGAQMIGLLLVAYVVDRLPMLRRWKTLLFLLCAVGALQVNLGLNYGFFRFIIAPAFLVLAARRRQPWAVAGCFLVGEALSLATSPEMAFAFGSASVAYAAYFCYREGRAWLVAAAAPFVATAGFLLLIDRSYLLTLKLFALGVFNFVVEPLPHILVFLFALVWLAPLGLAELFHERRPEATMMAALYLFSLALLPVALGRADPIHVFFNGLVIFFLSMAAISSFRLPQQAAWAVCVLLLFLGTPYLNNRIWAPQWRPVLASAVFHGRPDGLRHAAKVFAHTGSLKAARRSLHIVPEDVSFDIQQLDDIAGHAPVATPFGVPLSVEKELKRSGQYTPAYYCALTGVYDAGAEDRLIQELNQSQWALLPLDAELHITETPLDTRFVMGFQITYPERHAPYVVGDRFNENLATQWQASGAIGDFELYRRR